MQALHGIRVIDVSRVVAGPFCTYQLALMGADVIKIEEPGKGDPVRWSASGTDSRFRDIGMATTFLPQNSNKRSITLDLRKEEGKAIFRQLVQGADVVVENFRAGVMDGLGLGYNALLEINPKLIFCSLTGYGQHQPKGQHRAYDGLIQAASGMMTMVGTKDTGPLKVGPVIVDYTTGLVGAYAIGMALLQRHQTGKGQYIDVSMLNTALTMMSAIIVDRDLKRLSRIVSGVAVITEDGHAPITYRAGDCFIMKPGYTGTWRTLETVRKVWVAA